MHRALAVPDKNTVVIRNNDPNDPSQNVVMKGNECFAGVRVCVHMFILIHVTEAQPDVKVILRSQQR